MMIPLDQEKREFDLQSFSGCRPLPNGEVDDSGDREELKKRTAVNSPKRPL
jgi:hypothetical protein